MASPTAGRAEDLDARGVGGAGGEAHVVDGVVAAEGVADGVGGLRQADEGLAAAEVEEVRGHRHEASDGCGAGLAGVDGEGGPVGEHGGAGVGGLQAEADALEDEAQDGGHGGLASGPGELPPGAPAGEQRPAVGGVDDKGGLTSAVAALPTGDPEGGARRDLDARGRRVAGAHAELRAPADGGVRRLPTSL